LVSKKNGVRIQIVLFLMENMESGEQIGVEEEEGKIGVLDV
jgi:hypothetical protein